MAEWAPGGPDGQRLARSDWLVIGHGPADRRPAHGQSHDDRYDDEEPAERPGRSVLPVRMPTKQGVPPKKRRKRQYTWIDRWKPVESVHSSLACAVRRWWPKTRRSSDGPGKFRRQQSAGPPGRSSVLAESPVSVETGRACLGLLTVRGKQLPAHRSSSSSSSSGCSSGCCSPSAGRPTPGPPEGRRPASGGSPAPGRSQAPGRLPTPRGRARRSRPEPICSSTRRPRRATRPPRAGTRSRFRAGRSRRGCPPSSGTARPASRRRPGSGRPAGVISSSAVQAAPPSLAQAVRLGVSAAGHPIHRQRLAWRHEDERRRAQGPVPRRQRPRRVDRRPSAPSDGALTRSSPTAA